MSSLARKQGFELLISDIRRTNRRTDGNKLDGVPPREHLAAADYSKCKSGDTLERE